VAEHAAIHGGAAWVEDRPGGGSRFVVSFPVESLS
jgi:signal transduction histidine kinase